VKRLSYIEDARCLKVKPADVRSLPVTSVKCAENETFKITSHNNSERVQ